MWVCVSVSVWTGLSELCVGLLIRRELLVVLLDGGDGQRDVVEERPQQVVAEAVVEEVAHLR